MKGLLACRPTLDCKYETLPTVDDFLDTVESEDDTIVIREKKDTEFTLQRLVEKKQKTKNANSKPLVEVNNLSVFFRSAKGFFRRNTDEVRAVDGINLTIQQDAWSCR